MRAFRICFLLALVSSPLIAATLMSADHWLYVRALAVSTAEHLLHGWHRFIVHRVDQTGSHAYLATTIEATFSSHPEWIANFKALLIGSTAVAFMLGGLAYGALSPLLVSGDGKRHVRGARIHAQRPRSQFHRGVCQILMIGALLSAGLWLVLVECNQPDEVDFGSFLRWAVSHAFVDDPTGIHWRDFAIKVVVTGYGLAALIVVGWAWSRHAMVQTFRGWASRVHLPLPRGTLQLAGYPLSFDAETRHLLIVGRPGAGKTQVIEELLRGIRRRGARALIVDTGAGYVSRFSAAGDQILNPFDARSVRWSPFAEIRSPQDYMTLASAVIPESGSDHNEEWRSYARTLLAATMKRVHEEGRPSAAEVLRIINAATVEELKALFAGTNAAGLLRHDELFNSVVGIVAHHIGSWEHLPELDEAHPGFSIRDWVRKSDDTGWLYLTCTSDQQRTLKDLIATWLSIATTEGLCLPESYDNRLYLVIDEVDAIGAVSALRVSSPMLRKYGCVLVVGLQTIAQLRSNYGQDSAQSILGCLGHKVMFGVGDHETGEYLEREIGRREVERIRTSDAAGSSGQRDTRSKTIARENAEETVVLASELTGLPDLTGFIRWAGSAEVHRFKIAPVKMKRAVEPFVPRT